MIDLQEIKIQQFIVLYVLFFVILVLLVQVHYAKVLMNNLSRFYHYKFIKKSINDYYKLASDLKDGTEIILKNQDSLNLSNVNFHFEVIKGWFTTYFEYYDNKYVKGCNKKWYSSRGFKIYKKRKDTFTQEKLLLYVKAEYLEELNNELLSCDFNLKFKRVYFMSRRIKKPSVFHAPKTKENDGLDHTLIVGGIGTGKSTLARKLMGNQRNNTTTDLKFAVYNDIKDLSRYKAVLFEQEVVNALDYMDGGKKTVIDLINTTKHKECKIITENLRLEYVDKTFLKTVNKIYKLG